MADAFPPLPVSLRGDRAVVRWYNKVLKQLGDTAQIAWTQLNFTGSTLTSIATRTHANLQSIGEADDTDTDTDRDKHVSNNDMRVNTAHVASTSNPHSTTLAGLTTKPHSALTDVLGADDTDNNATQNKHVSNNDMRVNTAHVASTSNPHTVTAAQLSIEPWVLIESQTASASASLDYTSGFDGTYDHLMFVLSNVLPATNGNHLRILVSDDGTTWEADATDYEYHATQRRTDTAGVGSLINSQGSAFIRCTGSSGNAAGEGMSGRIYTYAPASTAVHHFHGMIVHMDNSTPAVAANSEFYGVHNGSTAPILGIQFFMNGGNIASGTIALYGLTK